MSRRAGQAKRIRAFRKNRIPVAVLRQLTKRNRMYPGVGGQRPVSRASPLSNAFGHHILLQKISAPLELDTDA